MSGYQPDDYRLLEMVSKKDLPMKKVRELGLQDSVQVCLADELVIIRHQHLVGGEEIHTREYVCLTPKGKALLVRRQRGDVVTAEAETKRSKKGTGRPLKEETPNDTKIIGALTTFLQRDNRNPPKGRDVVDLSGVANVSRFIRKHFGSQKKMEAAWRRGEMNLRLAKIQGLLSEGHEEYDDERLDTGGARRAGRTPGSHHDE